MAEQPGTFETLSIYQQCKKKGGSGRGVSYWNVPAMCGRKRRLMTDHPNVDSIGDHTALDTGIYYHFLQEMMYLGKIPEGVAIDADPVQDPEWGEAMRLFEFHRTHFGPKYWGEMIAVELSMPINPEHQEKIEKWLGHKEATGACDLVVKMSEEDVARIQEDREIELNGPGIYIIDHKTSSTRKSDTDARANYTSSIQSLTYLHMLGLALNEPVRGMVFDVVVKHKQLRRHGDGRSGSSVQTFVATPHVEDAKVVKAAIAYGMHQREHNLANPFACFDHGRECVYLSRGLCGRY